MADITRFVTYLYYYDGNVKKYNAGFAKVEVRGGQCRIELHIKDLNNAINAAHATATSLPLTASVMEMMQALKNDGCGKEDHSALVRYYEKISAVSVEKKD